MYTSPMTKHLLNIIIFSFVNLEIMTPQIAIFWVIAIFGVTT